MLRNTRACAMISLAMCLGTAATASTLSDLSKETTALVRNAAPSVVEIQAQKPASTATKTETKGSRVFWSTPKSVGSGFVIDPDGYILTTAHVVQGADKVTVKFADGTEAAGKITGTDELTNSAVIKVEKSGLKALLLGDSGSLEPGALVVSINSQAGMEGTASLGMVSGTGRQLSAGSDMIQISGTIGPGASGGPVLDPSGKVVGMTSAMLSPSPSALPFNFPSIELHSSGAGTEQLNDELRSAQEELRKGMEELRSGVAPLTDPDKPNELFWRRYAPDAALSLLGAAEQITRTSGSVGFAIPIDRITPILGDLKSGKEVERGFLGAVMGPKDGRIVFQQIEPGSPADKAGLRPGDVLVSADGRTFDGVRDLVDYVSARKPGGAMELVVERDGKEMTLRASLAQRPQPKAARRTTASTAIFRTFPLSLADANITEVAKALSDASGASIVVTDPQKLTRKVTVNLKSTTVDKALDTICRALGCTYKKDGNAYVISPK